MAETHTDLRREEVEECRWRDGKDGEKGWRGRAGRGLKYLSGRIFSMINMSMKCERCDLFSLNGQIRDAVLTLDFVIMERTAVELQMDTWACEEVP